MAPSEDLVDGAIAMLDVLGVKGIWRGGESVVEIIKKWDSIVFDFKAIEASLNIHESAKIEPRLQFFSDTVIVTYLGKDPTELLSYMSLHLTYPFCHALLQKIFFRGSISIGKFRRSDNMIIGPAIDEAAECYENYNWIGITLSPSARDIIEQNVENDGNHGWYEKFNVQGKNGVNDVWALNWPSHLKGVMSFMPDHRESRDAIEQALSNPPEEPRIKAKYTTTMSFFNKMIELRGETGLRHPSEST